MSYLALRCVHTIMRHTMQAQLQKHAKRAISEYCVLEVEAPSITHMVSNLKTFARAGERGEGNGNVVITFDVNGFGETITAPHIRRPPVVLETWRKLVKSVFQARTDDPEPAALPPGDIFVVVDGGRLNNTVFAKPFGVGPGVKRDRSNIMNG